jgi:hypothetical protein
VARRPGDTRGSAHRACYSLDQIADIHLSRCAKQGEREHDIRTLRGLEHRQPGATQLSDASPSTSQSPSACSAPNRSAHPRHHRPCQPRPGAHPRRLPRHGATRGRRPAPAGASGANHRNPPSPRNTLRAGAALVGDRQAGAHHRSGYRSSLRAAAALNRAAAQALLVPMAELPTTGIGPTGIAVTPAPLGALPVLVTHRDPGGLQALGQTRFQRH